MPFTEIVGGVNFFMLTLGGGGGAGTFCAHPFFERKIPIIKTGKKQNSFLIKVLIRMPSWKFSTKEMAKDQRGSEILFDKERTLVKFSLTI